MVFKERTFHGDAPPDEGIRSPGPHAAADLEAHAADFLASVPDLDATSVLVTAVDGGLVLSGFVASGLEGQKAEAALREKFAGAPVENRLRTG